MRNLLPGILLAVSLFLAVPYRAEIGAEAHAELQIPPKPKESSTLRDQVKKLADAFVKRDLAVIKSQISPNRLYVQIADKAGAYLSSGQTLVVMETFLRTRTVVSSSFDFVSDDGATGSASGTLSTQKAGRLFTYKLNFGFTRNDDDRWLLSRISMR